MGSRRVRGGNGVAEGYVRPLECELDGLPVLANLITVEVAGNVAEPVGQRLCDSPKTPVVGSGDGHRHRPARSHRLRIK